MLTSTPVNASLIRQAAANVQHRPVSLVAAIGVLAGSLWISHVGLVAALGKGELAGVMTLLLVCFSTLQWMSMGRARAARAAGARSQAALTAGNAALLFALESTLNTIGVVQLAAKAGSDWGAGLALVYAIAIAAGIAWFNLTVKFAACEPLEASRATPAIDVEPNDQDWPPPAARDDVTNVVPFALRDRSREEAQTLQAIYQLEMERPRIAEIEAMAARKDERGRWKPAAPAKAAKPAARQRKRKAIAA
jgi:hypothetical protein